MNRRRFAAPAPKPVVPTFSSLQAHLEARGRLPLDLALSLSLELVDAVARVHASRRVLGGFSTADVVVLPDGSLSVNAVARAGEDVSLDVFAVGTVLFQLFTGLTLNQARARLGVSPLHAAPPASAVNPALDDAIDALLGQLLDARPTARPHSLRLVQLNLEEVCELYELTPSREPLQALAAEPMGVVRAPAPRRVVPVVDLREDDEEEEDDEKESAEPVGPLRFDGWAVGLLAFGFAAFAMATTL